jgi:transposase
MMGRLERDQEQLFYSFCLEEVVPDDHQVRAIAAVLDLSWVYSELSPHYPALGRPSIDPVLMIRMLILGYASPDLRQHHPATGDLARWR